MLRSVILLSILVAAAAIQVENHFTPFPSAHLWDQSLDAKVIAGHNGAVYKNYGMNYTQVLLDDEVESSAVSADGSRVAFLKNDSTVAIYDSATLKQVATVSIPAWTDKGNISREETDIYLSQDGSHLAIYHKPGHKGLPIATTLFYTRQQDASYALSFIVDKNITTIAFSPNMTAFVAYGPRENDPNNMNLYWGNVVWQNKSLAITGQSWRTMDSHLEMDLTNAGLAYMQGGSGRPWIHDTKNDSVLVYIGDYAGELQHAIAALSDDGRYLFTLSRNRPLLRRYLIGNTFPLAYDSVLLPANVGVMMVTDATGSIIIAALNHTMSYIKVSGGEIGSICAIAECHDGLICAPGHYCQSAAGSKAYPGSPYIRLSGNTLTVRLLRNDTDVISCEKAGSTSVGVYIPAENHSQMGMYNNTYVDIAFMLADNKTTEWKTGAMLRGGNVKIPIEKPQGSTRLLVRIRTDCYNDKYDGEITLAPISFPADPTRKTLSKPATTTNGAGVLGLTAAVMMIAAMMIL